MVDIEGKFEIEIRAREISRGQTTAFIDRFSGYVSRVNPIFTLDQVHFSDIFVILKWTGVPLSIGDFQYGFQFLDNYLMNYFQAWKMSIKINAFEKET